MKISFVMHCSAVFPLHLKLLLLEKLSSALLDPGLVSSLCIIILAAEMLQYNQITEQQIICEYQFLPSVRACVRTCVCTVTSISAYYTCESDHFPCSCTCAIVTVANRTIRAHVTCNCTRTHTHARTYVLSHAHELN